MGEGQSNTTITNVKNIKTYIMYDVKAESKHVALLSHYTLYMFNTFNICYCCV